jgi:hypothetical protein
VDLRDHVRVRVGESAALGEDLDYLEGVADAPEDLGLVPGRCFGLNGPQSSTNTEGRKATLPNVIRVAVSGTLLETEFELPSTCEVEKVAVHERLTRLVADVLNPGAHADAPPNDSGT